jgi:hypothetical protein
MSTAIAIVAGPGGEQGRAVVVSPLVDGTLSPSPLVMPSCPLAARAAWPMTETTDLQPRIDLPDGEN